MPTISWSGSSTGSATMGTSTPHAFGPGNWNVTVDRNCVVKVYGSGAGMNGQSGGYGGVGASSNAAGFDVTMYSGRNYSLAVASNVGYGGDSATYLYDTVAAAHLTYLGTHGVGAGSGVAAAGGGAPGTPGKPGGYIAGGCGGGGGGGQNPFGDQGPLGNDGGPGGGGGSLGGATGGGLGMDEDGQTAGGGGGRGVQVPGSSVWYGGGGGGGGVAAGAGGVGGTGVITIMLSTSAQPAIPPTIHTIDNTTTGAVNDAVVVRGTTAAYTHVWGTDFTPGTYGDFSPPDGMSAPAAAYGDTTLVAVNITAAANAALGPRSFRVISAGYGSNWMTFNVVAAVPVLSSILAYGGGPAVGFVGIKLRVNLTGSGFDSAMSWIYDGAKLQITNVVVSSPTAASADFLGLSAATTTIAVQTSGGTSAAVSFQMIDPVPAAPQFNPGMVTNVIHGTQHNTVTGTLGMHFTVGAGNRRVTHLGRWRVGTDTGKHEIVVRNDQWVIVARAIVDLASGAADTWVYTALPVPVTLKAGQNYMLSDMSFVSGRDRWDNISSVLLDGKAISNGVVHEVDAIYNFTRGTDRVDAYAVGYQFKPNAAYNLTALGRWKIPGNSLAHRIVLKDAAGTIIRSATVDFTGGKGVDSAFNYASVPMLTLTTGTTYYLFSEEGVDVWPENNTPGTMVTPSGVVQITGAIYQPLPLVDGLAGLGVDATANSMWSAPGMLVWGLGWSGYSEAYVTVNLQWQNAQQPMAMII